MFVHRIRGCALNKPKQFIPSFYFLNKNNNFKQRISWFSYRWRPKRISIFNANCWFRESSNCWTHIALLHKRSIFVWVCVEITWRPRLSACGERFFFVSSLKNTHINRNMFLLGECESMVPSKRNFEAHNSSLPIDTRLRIFKNHTSNQRRLPAGLKHLIKPRKRN